MAASFNRLLSCLAAPAFAALVIGSAHAQTALQTGQALLAGAATPATDPAATTPANPAAPATGAATAPAAAPAAAEPGAAHTIKATDPTKPSIDVPPAETPSGSLDAQFVQSFFLTPLDLVALTNASKGRVTAQGPDGSTGQEIPQVRKITLSGVAFKNPDDWVVWINGHKIAPGIGMTEIVDIKVERDLVHLKWFDIGLNGIINITMRPHETYDIVTGVLLPGGP